MDAPLLAATESPVIEGQESRTKEESIFRGRSWCIRFGEFNELCDDGFPAGLRL